MPLTYYAAPKIFTGEDWITGHAIAVAEEQIDALIPESEIPEEARVLRFQDAFMAPAFMDLQIYGANKKLLAVHPTADALHDLYAHCIAGGTTLFQPTVATNTEDVFFAAIDAVRSYRQQGGRGVIGLHVEGPWISMEKRGAHLPQCVHRPTVEDAMRLLERGRDVITMITLAPEEVSEEVVRLVQSYGVVVSAGHSNADFDMANKAFDAGNIGVATHLYNAMSPLQHRQPGMVGALLLHPTARASIIPDGHHVDYAAVQLAYRMMGNRLFAITDAVTETAEGGYRHQLVGNKYESNGILSGSALTMHAAFKNLVQHAGIPVADALRMCSFIPAGVMGLTQKNGRIAPGCAAQMVVIGEDLSLVQTIV